MVKRKKKKAAAFAYKNPSFSQYKKAIEKSSPEVREEIHKLYKSKPTKEATEVKEEARRKLYGKQKEVAKFKEGVAKVGKKIVAYGDKRTVSRKILRKSKVAYKVQNKESAPYVSRYFKNEWEEAKGSLFMK